MPIADLGSARLYYVVDGPSDAPALVLSNSLGTTADMWAPQMPALTERFRVIRYDTRGHGLSSCPPGDYTFDQLADDVAGLLDHLKIAKAHFCGLSMGGPTGLQLALAQPHRVEKLVLCNTAARLGSVEGWNARMAAVAETGLDELAPSLIERWITPAFRRHRPVQTRQLLDMLRRSPEAGYINCCAALRACDLRNRLAAVAVPALVIAGTHDLAATPEQGRELAAGIGGARYVELDASHLSNWEQAEAFTETLLEFLGGPPR
jgi:3-oxoadipate enol-lactonase